MIPELSQALASATGSEPLAQCEVEGRKTCDVRSRTRCRRRAKRSEATAESNGIRNRWRSRAADAPRFPTDRWWTNDRMQ